MLNDIIGNVVFYSLIVLIIGMLVIGVGAFIQRHAVISHRKRKSESLIAFQSEDSKYADWYIEAESRISKMPNHKVRSEHHRISVDIARIMATIPKDADFPTTIEFDNTMNTESYVYTSDNLLHMVYYQSTLARYMQHNMRYSVETHAA